MITLITSKTHTSYWTPRESGYLNTDTGEVFYKPRVGEDINTAEIIAPRLEILVKVIGTLEQPAHHIQFQGITFQETTWLKPNTTGIEGRQSVDFAEKATGAVHLENANNILLERNLLRNLGGGGIVLYSAASDNVIRGNVIKDTGVGGISVDLLGIKNPTNPLVVCRRNIVSNNYITRVGRDFSSVSGIFAGLTDGTVIEHNEVFDTPYTGISVGWVLFYDESTQMQNNVIRYNRVHGIMNLLDDGAGLYTGNWQPGTQIYENYVYDMTKSPWALNGCPVYPTECFYGPGVYLDQFSRYIVVKNNVTRNVPMGIFLHQAVQNTVINWVGTKSQLAGWGNVFTSDGTLSKSAVMANAGLEAAYADIPQKGAPSFVPASYILTVLKSGAGSGTVEGDSLDCGAVCSVALPAGTSVTLHAVPGPGSAFFGWSGPCSGSQACTLVVEEDTIVTAIFGETTGPTLSVPTISAVTSTSATISWTTDQPADTQVAYGLTTALGAFSVLNPVLVSVHSVTLSGLAPNSLYYFQARSKDAADNLGTAEGVFATGVGSTSILINGSFESDYLGWTATGNQGIRPRASDGVKAVAFNGGQMPPDGVLSQSFTTTAGQTYLLQFDEGVYAYNGDEQRLQVTVQGQAVLVAQTLSVFGTGNGQTSWVPRSYPFVADRGTTTLTFKDLSPATANLDLLLDNVRVTLQGAVAPVITGQPQSVTVAAGGSASFSVTASGNAPLSYQWRFNGTPISGATGSTYSIASVQASHGGNYDVVLSNGGGSVTSATALLTVATGSILTNGSFESDYLGWAATGNQMIRPRASDGVKAVAFNAGQTTPDGVLSQSFTTTAGQTYLLQFDEGVYAYNGDEQRLQVTVQGQAVLVAQTLSVFGTGNGQTSWVPRSYPFVADRGTTTLTFKDLSPATANLDLLLDNVRVTLQAGAAQISLKARSGTLAHPLPLVDGTISLLRLTRGYRISLSNVSTGWYELQRSSDLKSWSSVAQVKASALGTAQFDDLDAGAEVSFYRVVLAEPSEEMMW